MCDVSIRLGYLIR